MAVIPDDLGPAGETQYEIERSQWKLWFAKMEETGSVSAAGGYVVDPERAQECIDEISSILIDVERSFFLVRRLHFDSPGYDPVSTNVASNGSIMASRAEAYVRAWADQVKTTRDALQLQLNAYAEVEQANERRLT